MNSMLGQDAFMGNSFDDTDSLFSNPFLEDPVPSINTSQVNQGYAAAKQSSKPSLVQWNPAYAVVQQPPPSPVLIEHPLSLLDPHPEPSTHPDADWLPRPASSSSSATSSSQASPPAKKKGGRRGKKASDSDPLKPTSTKVAKKTLRKDSCEPCRASHTPCHVSPGNTACQSCLDKGRDCVYGADGRTTRDNMAKLEHQVNYITDLAHKWHCVLQFLATDSEPNDTTRDSQVHDILVDLNQEGPSTCYTSMENHRFPAVYRPFLMTSPRDTTGNFDPDCVTQAKRVLGGEPRLADLRKAQRALADGATAHLETLWRIMLDVWTPSALRTSVQKKLQVLYFALKGKDWSRLEQEGITLRPLEPKHQKILAGIRKNLKDDRFCAQFGKQDLFQPHPPAPLPPKPAKGGGHAAAYATPSPSQSPVQAFVPAPMASVAPVAVPAIDPALVVAATPTPAPAQAVPAAYPTPSDVFFNQPAAVTPDNIMAEVEQHQPQPQPLNMFELVEQVGQQAQQRHQEMTMSFDFSETLDDDNNINIVAATITGNTVGVVQEPVVAEEAFDEEKIKLLQQVVAEEDGSNSILAAEGSWMAPSAPVAEGLMRYSVPLSQEEEQEMFGNMANSMCEMDFSM